MTELKSYLNDGANYQAKAVLAFLQGSLYLDSKEVEGEKYEPNLQVSRWENCREQGYVIRLISHDYNEQLNIAFFEHRNSDEICAVKWIQSPTINAPTIYNAKFGDVYKDKYDVSKGVGFGEIKKMSDWICEKFNDFWEKE